jgi:hypothetical protein
VLAVAGISRGRGLRLINIGRGAEGVRRELNSSVGNLDLGTVDKVSISGNGDTGAISFRDGVVVLELSSGKVLLRQDGRLGSISPDGVKLAFVDSGRRLMVRSIRGANAASLGIDRVEGVAAWSPDGRYLLASAFTGASFWKRLLAVDVLGGSFCELARIREGDDGSRSAWIARHLTAS